MKSAIALLFAIDELECKWVTIEKENIGNILVSDCEFFNNSEKYQTELEAVNEI